MSTILGNNLIVSLGGQAIFGAKSCTLTVDAGVIPTSSATDGTWEHSEVGRKSWKVQTSHIVLSTGWTSLATNPLAAASMVGQKYIMQLSISDVTGATLTGTSICKTFRIAGSVGALASGSFQFEGDGPLDPPVQQ